MDSANPEKTSKWLRRAVERVRDFAYAEREPLDASALGRPKIGVALGGGFARGVSHLGVLRVLEENQIPIDFIAGTSAGAVAGVAYATGLPFEVISQRAAELRFTHFGQWKFSWLGLASNKRLETYPKHFLGIERFEELKIPMSIVATDLLTGEMVAFSRGPIGPALRASCAYPGLFQPVDYEGHLLVDGFVSATVPVDAALQMGADVVIAVLLEAEGPKRPSNFTDVLGRTFAIIQRHADVNWLAKADVVVLPQVRDFAWDDFPKTPLLIEAGRAATLAVLPKIKTTIEAAAARLANPDSPSAPAVKRKTPQKAPQKGRAST